MYIFSLFLEAILESCGALQQLVPGLEGQIVSQVVNRASQGLEAAKNIPRLYRRTNKEVTHYYAESACCELGTKKPESPKRFKCMTSRIPMQGSNHVISFQLA